MNMTRSRFTHVREGTPTDSLEIFLGFRNATTSSELTENPFFNSHVKKVMRITHGMQKFLPLIRFQPVRLYLQWFVQQFAQLFVQLRQALHRLHHATNDVSSHSWNPRLIFRQRMSTRRF